MATPAYLGQGQPASDNGGGWLGRFGSFFGASTPAYAPAPSVKQTEQPSEDQRDAAEAQASCPINPEALAAGQIAIVIPRQQ